MSNIEFTERKILFIDQYGGVYGAQRILFDLVTYFFNRNYEVFVAVPGREELEKRIKSLGIQFIPLTTKAINVKSRIFVIFRLLIVLISEYFLILKNLKRSKKKCAVVYCNGLRVLPLAFLISFLNNIPLIIHIHLTCESKFVKTVLYLLTRFTTAKFVFVSNVAQYYALKNYKSKNINIVHNWVLPDFLSEGERILEDKINKLIKEPILRVAYVGRISSLKGVHILIKAMIHLSSMKEKIQCTLAGGIGHELHERDYFNSLKELVSKETIRDQITFLGEINDVSQIYKNAHIVVIPSLCLESFGLVAIEAMSFGCVVIASNIGGLTEIIDSKKNGFLFQAGNVDELSELILYCNKERALCAELVRAARLDVERKFNPEIQLDMISKICNS